MKSRPILFSGPMVRALLDGRKTQTRRVVKPLTKRHPVVNLAEHGVSQRAYSGRFNDPASWGYAAAEDGNDVALGDWTELCPYGQPGDLLWVRESIWQPPFITDRMMREGADTWPEAIYQADAEWYRPHPTRSGLNLAPTPAGRDLEVEVEREWCREHKWKSVGSIHMPRWASRLTLRITDVRVQRLNEISDGDCVSEGVSLNSFKLPGDTALVCYRRIWEEIHGSFSWGDNPWVWALTFEVLRENVDSMLARRAAA